MKLLIDDRCFIAAEKATEEVDPWEYTTVCLVAQSAMRRFGKKVKSCSLQTVFFTDNERVEFANHLVADQIISAFDRYTSARGRDNPSGEDIAKARNEVRAMLPITLEIVGVRRPLTLRRQFSTWLSRLFSR